MKPATRNRAAAALLSFAIAATAGWLTAESDVQEKPRAIPSAAVRPAPPPTTAAALSAAKSPVAAVAALERTLLASLDPAGEIHSGERLAELCLGDHPQDLPGLNEAFSYASRWAAKDPQGMFEWFLQRGKFTLAAVDSSYGFLSNIFREWAKHDAKAAVAAALRCSAKRDRAEAIATVIEALRKTDPARAAGLAAEHIGILSPPKEAAHLFSAYGEGFEETWTLLRGLPSGKSRADILARYFEEVTRYHAGDVGRLWREAPEDVRRDLVAGGFEFRYAAMLRDAAKSGEKPPVFDGLPELMRQHAETSGDPQAAKKFLDTAGSEWAQRDPAGAVSWALAHLKGEQRVNGTAELFLSAAARDFDEAVREWQSLPDGILKARAAGNMAAGAPEERKADMQALLENLPSGDLSIVEASRSVAVKRRESRAATERSMQQIRARQ